jgi:hypothetical protein
MYVLSIPVTLFSPIANATILDNLTDGILFLFVFKQKFIHTI